MRAGVCLGRRGRGYSTYRPPFRSRSGISRGPRLSYSTRGVKSRGSRPNPSNPSLFCCFTVSLVFVNSQ